MERLGDFTQGPYKCIGTARPGDAAELQCFAVLKDASSPNIVPAIQELRLIDSALVARTTRTST